MFRALFLVLMLSLSACATQNVPVLDTPVSRLGVISNLPTNANNIYMGVTVFENDFEEIQVPWDFSSAVVDEFKNQMEARGGELHDLSGRPEIEAQRGNWFETGYSLKFGLSAHKFSSENAALLRRTMAEYKLDAILILQPRRYNSDIPYGEADPKGGFGVFRRGGIFRKDRAYTFVQIEGRLIAGTPPSVLDDLDGSNLVSIVRANERLNLGSDGFKSQIAAQIRSAVSKMLVQLGI